MIIDREVIIRCNRYGKVEFTSIETGQDFVILTRERYLELEEKAP